MDVFALAIALAAAIGASRPANRRKTFGYGRVEVLGAVFNGSVLFAAALVLAYAAVRRFGAPVEPRATLMTTVACIGLVANVTIGFTLAGHHRHDLNVRAALFHVLGDALGAIGVIVGGSLILLTHAAWIDPLVSLFVAAIVIVGVIRVLRDAGDVLLEGTPPDIDSAEVERSIAQLDGVVSVHDLHVWSIGSESRALSAHVLLDDRRISQAAAILASLRQVALERYGVGHVTVQLECEHCDPGGVIICRPDEGPAGAGGNPSG
jgi:cobalt-zinc-cadmium efflux system protein